MVILMDDFALNPLVKRVHVKSKRLNHRSLLIQSHWFDLFEDVGIKLLMCLNPKTV